jgi:hypothetical protein
MKWLMAQSSTVPFPLTPALFLGERTPRHSDALCAPEPQDGPLTPALSPSEGERGNRRQLSGEPRFRGRENRIPSHDQPEPVGFTAAWATGLPLLGERAGVRGNGSCPNPTCRTTAGTVKLQESSGRAKPVENQPGRPRKLCQERHGQAGHTHLHGQAAQKLGSPLLSMEGLLGRSPPGEAFWPSGTAGGQPAFGTRIGFSVFWLFLARWLGEVVSRG